MSLSRPALLALCLVSAALAGGRAHAQANQDRPFDAKPFLPPILPLPPNAQVNPGSIDLTPSPSNPAAVSNPQTPAPVGGLRITIPTR